MSDELTGKSFGRYQPLEALGTGGMASVYRAYDSTEKRDVALKILPAHMANNEVFRQRFFREAKMVAHLQHPNILPIYDFGKEGDMLYIVFKLVTGGSLADMIRDHSPLDYRTIVRIVVQIGSALDYAHAQGIIHRDLKPENILLDKPTDTAYLCDFGIAYSDDSMGMVTKSGAFVGTAVYASPEQCQGMALTPISDIYSFGAVLYEMLTGQPPYDGPTQIAIMHKHVNEPLPNPLLLRPDLPGGVVEVVRKALAKPIQVRYQSAGALSGALYEVLRREMGPANLPDQSAASATSSPPELPTRAASAPPLAPRVTANVSQPIRREDLRPLVTPRPFKSVSVPKKKVTTAPAHHWSIIVLWISALVVLLLTLALILLTQ